MCVTSSRQDVCFIGSSRIFVEGQLINIFSLSGLCNDLCCSYSALKASIENTLVIGCNWVPIKLYLQNRWQARIGCSLPIPGLERVLGIMCIIRTVFSHSPFYLKRNPRPTQMKWLTPRPLQSTIFPCCSLSPVTEWKPKWQLPPWSGGGWRREGRAEQSDSACKGAPNLFSLMVTGACLHFVHVFMLGFSGGRTIRQGGLELPSTWFYGLGLITAPLWSSFSLTCKMRGLSWWSWTPILFSSFSSSVFFSIFPINPQWFLSWDLLSGLGGRGVKVSSPTQVSTQVTCFLCFPGQLTPLQASQKPDGLMASRAQSWLP